MTHPIGSQVGLSRDLHDNTVAVVEFDYTIITLFFSDIFFLFKVATFQIFISKFGKTTLVDIVLSVRTGAYAYSCSAVAVLDLVSALSCFSSLTRTLSTAMTVIRCVPPSQTSHF